VTQSFNEAVISVKTHKRSLYKKRSTAALVIPTKAPNPWLQASWLPGASRYVPAHMYSRFHGNDWRFLVACCVTLVKKEKPDPHEKSLS
jgi:predicted DCC family thiol-disulfide oxidoreductase YuxK